MKKMIYDFLIKIMTINSVLKIFILTLLSILLFILAFLKIKINTLIINISIAIIIILVIIVIIIDIMNIIIINKKNNDCVLQSKLINIASIIYKIIDNNNYDITEDMDIENQNNIIELNKIKKDIDVIYNTYYKYYFYSNIINDIKIKLIIMKRKILKKAIIAEINIHKSITTKEELQIFIKMKLNGLNTDLNIYKNHLKDFFNSLNDIDDINTKLLYK
jgi:hypothetical protein